MTRRLLDLLDAEMFAGSVYSVTPLGQSGELGDLSLFGVCAVRSTVVRAICDLFKPSVFFSVECTC